MILVQNRLRLLNGNNYFLFLFALLFFSSCGIFSDSGRRPRHKRKKTHVKHHPKKKNTSKVDSLQWPSDKSDDSHQKNGEEAYGTVKKDHYVVDFLIPFGANKSFNNLEELEKSSSNKFLHFYIGVMLALEDLEKQGIGITINVFDAPIKNNRISVIKSKMSLDKPDVIVGPYVKSQLKEMAYYSKRKEVTMVNPWNAFSSVAVDNPNYIQLKPDLNQYYETIVNDVDEKYSPKDVYLIGLDDKYHKRRLAKLQTIHLDNNKGVDKYNTFIINRDSLNKGETAFDTLFTKNTYKTKVIIIPNWSFKDENFIYSALRRINIEKGEQKVIVYGLPQVLLNSTKIGYNLFKRLNIRVASSNYLDDKNWDVKRFKNRFYKMAFTFPERHNYAYDGYDTMMFIGKNLKKYGTKFQYFIENNEQDYLNNSILLLRNVKDENIKNEELDKINYFENSKMNILGFQRNRFDKFK